MLTRQDRFYLSSIKTVLATTPAYERGVHTLGRRVALPGGIPFQFVGRPIYGPQCVTVAMQVRSQELRVVETLGDQFAHRAGSEMARVYRDLNLVRVEFNLPREQWREVPLASLRHTPQYATVGLKAIGATARIGFSPPHKAVFGGSQTGKTICLIDCALSLARTHSPEACRFLVVNPKNDEKFRPLERLAHLQAPIATSYDDGAALLRFALAEMEKRIGDKSRCGQRWIIFVDEIAELTQVHPETGLVITRLSQMAGGLNMNLIVASQAPNPSVFGPKGSLAQANFGGRIVFQLPNTHAYLATNVSGLKTGALGRDGDAFAVTGDRVTRIRAALPAEVDYDRLPRVEAAPAMPEPEDLAGDTALNWSLAELADRAAFARVDQQRRALAEPSATAIQREFGGAMDRARWVRELVRRIEERTTYWEATS